MTATQRKTSKGRLAGVLRSEAGTKFTVTTHHAGERWSGDVYEVRIDGEKIGTVNREIVAFTISGSSPFIQGWRATRLDGTKVSKGWGGRLSRFDASTTMSGAALHLALGYMKDSTGEGMYARTASTIRKMEKAKAKHAAWLAASSFSSSGER